MNDAPTRLHNLTDLTNFPHDVRGRTRWAVDPLSQGPLYLADDRPHLMGFEATPATARPPLGLSDLYDARLELIYYEYEGEDGRTRSGSGNIYICPALLLPTGLYDDLRRLVTAYQRWFKNQWCFVFDVPRFEFPTPRTMEKDSRIPDQWVHRSVLSSFEIVLFEIGIDTEVVADLLQDRERDRVLQSIDCPKVEIGRWTTCADRFVRSGSQ